MVDVGTWGRLQRTLNHVLCRGCVDVRNGQCGVPADVPAVPMSTARYTWDITAQSICGDRPLLRYDHAARFPFYGHASESPMMAFVRLASLDADTYEHYGQTILFSRPGGAPPLGF